jgi:UDP-N-acetylglucosamine transferase subunit ALG13
MIFVTVGNATQRFDRLLLAVSNSVAQGVYGGEEVLVQAGSAFDVSMPGCRVVGVMSPIEFGRVMQEATAVISHCGAGTVLHAIKAGHCPIVMPRLPRLSEGLEDQSDLLRALESTGRVIGLIDGRTMEWAWTELRSRRRIGKTGLGAPSIVDMVGNTIRQIVASRSLS